MLNGHVYYHAVTAYTALASTEAALVDARLSAATLVQVEKVCDSGFHDGMVAAADAHLNGTLLLTALNKDGIDMVLQDGRVESSYPMSVCSGLTRWLCRAGRQRQATRVCDCESREYTTVHSRRPRRVSSLCTLPCTARA